MKRITEEQYKICKNHGLIYDGKNVYKGLDKKIERAGFRTFCRTRHGIYVSEGSQGIYDSMIYFEKKDGATNGGRK